MTSTLPHRWDVTPAQAIEIQRALARDVIIGGGPETIKMIAGADVHPSQRKGWLRAVFCVLSFPGLALLEEQTAEEKVSFPYISGLLSFREGPAVLKCFGKLENRPDVILFDGQGIAHPRRMGLASHMGLWLNIPSIGCAKSRLSGRCTPPGNRKGDASPITDEQGNEIGACLRTKPDVKPLYVSVGHKMGLSRAAALVLTATTHYRLPEPLRLAHARARSG